MSETHIEYKESWKIVVYMSSFDWRTWNYIITKGDILITGFVGASNRHEAVVNAYSKEIGEW